MYVDTVGDAERYEEKLTQLFPYIQFCVRKKADSLFPIVSAASICAKVNFLFLRTIYFADQLTQVTRDRSLSGFVFQEQLPSRERVQESRKRTTDVRGCEVCADSADLVSANFGSGYPGGRIHVHDP